jgi:nucleoside 2-deoxyribosyltransferase
MGTPTVYLCGAINGRPDSECKDWREYVKRRYAGAAIDPMSRDYRGREDECVSEIVDLDKADIDACGALLVYYDKPSVGTSMEILYAFERGKPVILVDASAAELTPQFASVKRSLSPWLKYHSHSIYQSIDAAIAALAAL